MLSQEHNSTDEVIFNEKFHKVNHSKVPVTNALSSTDDIIVQASELIQKFDEHSVSYKHKIGVIYQKMGQVWLFKNIFSTCV